MELENLFAFFLGQALWEKKREVEEKNGAVSVNWRDGEKSDNLSLLTDGIFRW